LQALLWQQLPNQSFDLIILVKGGIA